MRTEKRWSWDEDDHYEKEETESKKDRGGVPRAAIIGLVVALALMAAVAIIPFYIRARRDSDVASQREREKKSVDQFRTPMKMRPLKETKVPPPTGWKEYSYPDDKFKAYFPEQPHFDPNEIQEIRSKKIKNENVYSVLVKELVVEVAVIRFQPGSIPLQDEDKYFLDFVHLLVSRQKNRRASELEGVWWEGRSARELTMEEFLPNATGPKSGCRLRYSVLNYPENITYFAMIGSDVRVLNPEMEDAFFDNFIWLD